MKGRKEGRKEGRRRRKRTQLLDVLRNRKYWELKEEAEDRGGGGDSLSIEHKEEILSSISP